MQHGSCPRRRAPCLQRFTDHQRRTAGRGAIGHHEAARGFYAALPDMQVFFDDLVVDGDRVEYHWTFTGTNTGPGGTGNKVRVSGFEDWTIDNDGLIAASLGHYDQAEYARQLEHGVQDQSADG